MDDPLYDFNKMTDEELRYTYHSLVASAEYAEARLQSIRDQLEEAEDEVAAMRYRAGKASFLLTARKGTQ